MVFRDQKMSDSEARRALDLAFEQLREEIREGLRHGFFDLSVSCEIVNGKKRRLIIKAGKNHQFMIPEEQISSPY